MRSSHAGNAGPEDTDQSSRLPSRLRLTRIDDSGLTFARNATDTRTVDFVRRGRLGYGGSECWQVRLSSNMNGISLGTAFGIRDHACIVTAGLDRIGAVT